MKIPRCMSTQHPDNVTVPFFAENSLMKDHDEVQEAYYAFSHLDITEQLWDAEGKEVDTSVVKKLLGTYDQFFRSRRLGRDLFLTVRLPNPTIDKAEAKVFTETLESIPRSFDAAKAFYGDDLPPIFEVVLPMTSSADELNRTWNYYTTCVVGKQDASLGSMRVRDWIGEYKPEQLSLIPLIEDKASFQNIKTIIKGYVEGKRIERQRVWLARSDPALNYGWLAAVLLNKAAMAELEELEKEISIDLAPIIGVGSAPFRGNFRPDNLNALKGYPSVQTFTIQSAFKYDYPNRQVRDAIDQITSTARGKAIPVERERVSEMGERFSKAYEKQLLLIAPWVQKMAKHIPARRQRKLHIGLFGYARATAGLKLPRAITFCAALYSLGIPPELLGMDALTDKDAEFLESTIYRNLPGDVQSALQYANRRNVAQIAPALLPQLTKALEQFDVATNEEHEKATSEVLQALHANDEAALHQHILKAAWARRFIG